MAGRLDGLPAEREPSLERTTCDSAVAVLEKSVE